MISSVRRIAVARGRFQARCNSSTAAVSSSAPRRLVVSRRAWQEFQKTLPKKPKQKVEKPEDKPWPRNVQLAGYAAAAIFIPYATVWLITSNPSLRNMFQGILPLDRLRKHFGEEEWDAQSYVDDYELVDGYYRFPSEASYLERQQEAIIEAFENTKVAANLYLLSSDQSEKHVKEVPASTRANRKTLSEILGNRELKEVAVDFVDSDADDSSSQTTFGDAVTSSEMFDAAVDPTRPLLKSMHIYSSWHHLPSPQAPQEGSQASNAELEIRRLEFIVDDLEKKLKDPTCTRDIDDMMTELRQSKKELRRLKWKRRLGW